MSEHAPNSKRNVRLTFAIYGCDLLKKINSKWNIQFTFLRVLDLIWQKMTFENTVKSRCTKIFSNFKNLKRNFQKKTTQTICRIQKNQSESLLYLNKCNCFRICVLFCCIFPRTSFYSLLKNKNLEKNLIFTFGQFSIKLLKNLSFFMTKLNDTENEYV